MAAYYNEHDAYAAAWLRNLIAAGHIAPGVVDERDIRDVRPSDLDGFRQCHFFAGIGVWSYALRLAGWPDERLVWTGSCPCQPFSAAGGRGGFADERHLWPSWHHLIRECRPSVVYGEQVASKDGLAWLDLVQADLEAANYGCGAVDLCAAGVGAPHIRQRLWFVADAGHMLRTARPSGREQQPAPPILEGTGGNCATGLLGNASGSGLQGRERSQLQGSGWRGEGRAIGQPSRSFWSDADWISCRDGKDRPVEPGTFPLAHGATARVGRLRAYGNAINAEAAAAFIAAADEALFDAELFRLGGFFA